MPTFDITSTFDKQEVTNAVDQMNRELVNRYDFRGTNTTALLSENNITIKSSTISKTVYSTCTINTIIVSIIP